MKIGWLALVLLFAYPAQADSTTNDTVTLSGGTALIDFSLPSTITVTPGDGPIPFFELLGASGQAFGWNFVPDGSAFLFGLTFANDPAWGGPNFEAVCLSGGNNVGMPSVCDGNWAMSFTDFPFTVQGDQLTLIPGSYNDGELTITADVAQVPIPAPEPGSRVLLVLGVLALLIFASEQRAKRLAS